MGRQKLIRFDQNANSANVIQPGKELFTRIKGNWKDYFEGSAPITIEVGCGRAEYTTGMATLFPGRNFIGIDLKGNRIWKGSQVANENGLTNTAFLRIMIQNIQDFFEEDEVDEIWITFPDPRPKDGDEKLRLTSLRYLKMYKKIMKKGGWVHLKTDNQGLFDYTLSVVAADSEHVRSGELKISELEFTSDLYNSPLRPLAFDIQTTYEKRYLKEGVAIKFIRFRLW